MLGAMVTANGSKHDSAADSSGQGAVAEAWLIYDGECPFCSAYVKYLRVRESVGRFHLVDAREGGPLVEELRQKGIDLDEGMALKIGDRVYHGADCIHMLALLSTPSSLFNKINSRIFRSPMLARNLYPILRAGRNATLRLLGRRKMGSTLRPSR
jgi:predicted DCC family thiol-disulfide oxidoreductase YuxK